MLCKALEILKWVKVPGKIKQKMPGGRFSENHSQFKQAL